MDYHVYQLLECSNGYATYLVRLNYTPRKAGKLDEFGNAIADQYNTVDGKQRPIDSIPPEEREELKRKLKQGQGDLSLQEWDDFLADLVDMGLITNDQRHYSTGFLREVPEHGHGCRSFGEASADLDTLWTGNPLKWMNNLDMYYLKNELYANMGCRSNISFSPQRSALFTVSELVKDLLDS